MAEERRLPERVEGEELFREEKNDSGGVSESAAVRAILDDGELSLECSVTGEPLSVPQNYTKILRDNSYFGGKFRFNDLTGKQEISGVYWQTNPHPIRDEDLDRIRLLMSRAYGLKNRDEVKRAITIAAAENRYHPVREKLNDLKWDGQRRIGELFPRYLGAERSDYTAEVTAVFLFGAITRVFQPGVKFDLCPVLKDKQQGSGKSSMCRFLALDDEWFVDNLPDMSDAKKAFETIRAHWICELGEMIATGRKKNIESIKGFLSRQRDTYREPYATFAEDYPRQCVFIGTTNNSYFLPDDKTGNRRFLPIVCDYRKAERHPLADERETREFVAQCYAEAMELFRQGKSRLTIDHRYEAELAAMQEASAPEDPDVGIIQEWLDRNSKIDCVCQIMIWDNVFAKNDTRKPDKYQLDHIAEIMSTRITGWQPYKADGGRSRENRRHFDGYGRQVAWVRVPADEASGWLDPADEMDEIPF